MVEHQQAALNRVFAALSDPTRRALLEQLSGQPGVSVSELASAYPISLPAVMKHLDVLSGAGLITRAKSGRTVACRLNAAPMEQAMKWLGRYERFWSEQLDRLAAFVEEVPCPPNPASPSSAASTPRRRKSSRPGSSRKK
ncbi:MAG: helix-turn-helix transcriptional regulator [Nevskia sp.]|nr:helix-turn-helix transcriptional regulator [Nevskia sp.]